MLKRESLRAPLVGVAAIIGTLALSGGVAAQSAASTAVAEVRDASGASLGTARFRQVADGVLVEADLHNVPGPVGLRGVHLHQYGKCEPTGFETAGAHYNPTDRQHGLKNRNGFHIGDLINQDDPNAGSNIQVNADGSARVRMLAEDASVGPGSSALLDDDGASLVVHEQTDDNRSNPAGNSGARSACGVLTSSSG